MSVSDLQINIDDDARPTNAEQRTEDRISFYRGEFSAAKLVIGQKTYEADVYDISATGAAIIPKTAVVGLDTINQEFLFLLSNTEPRKAKLKSIGHIKFSGAFRLKLGIEFEVMDVDHEDFGKKIDCESNMPLAYCEDPISFSKTRLFNVSYFTPKGLGLLCDGENAAFYDGLKLFIHLMLPIRGEFTQTVTIRTINRKNGVMFLHCEWDEKQIQLMNAISEFLIMSVNDLRISHLKSLGFLVKNLERAFIVKCAQTPEDFKKILKLRLLTAKADGRWLDQQDPKIMEDSWDANSRQVYCEVNGQVIAAARIVFNDGLQERSEHKGYGVSIPDWLWKDGFVECSRLCTHPDYRGSSALILIMQHVTRITVQSNHKHAILNCVDSLVPMYQKYLGVTLLGERFYTKYMEDRALNLLYVDAKKTYGGQHISPIHSAIYDTVGDYLEEQGVVKFSIWERFARRLFKVYHALLVKIFTLKSK